MTIVAKIAKVIDHFSALQINHDILLTDMSDEQTMKLIACVDSLQHAAHKAIEEQYANFNPEATHSEQLEFYKRIINIKTQLRSLEFIHIDLSKKLNEKKLIYVKEENSTALRKYSYKYGRKEQESLRDHYYQLLEKIKSNNALKEHEFEFINSLLMQIISRPEGQKLIIKLNSQLEENEATLQIILNRDFGCSSPMEGAKENLNVILSPESQLDYRKAIKESTLKSEGAKKCVVYLSKDYLKSTSALNVDAYASMDQGLTDIGSASILFAHELIHATHILSGSSRSDFKPFFDVIDKKNDKIMEVLYAKASNTKLGNAAEEYWTIEGGNICENNIRKEHGFSSRTGHISLSPGAGDGYMMADLYCLGLQRNPTIDNMTKYLRYTTRRQEYSSDEIIEMEKDEYALGKALKFLKLQLQACTPQEVVVGFQKLSPDMLTRTIRNLNQLQADVGDIQDLTKKEKDELWISFLSALPFGVCKSLLAISSLMQDPLPEEERVHFWKEALTDMKPEDIEKAITHFQMIETMLNSWMTNCARTEELTKMRSFIHTLQTQTKSPRFKILK